MFENASQAERVSKAVKQIADNSERIKVSTAQSVNRAVKLNTLFNQMIGSSNKVLSNVNGLVSVLKSATGHATNVTNALNNTNQATKKIDENLKHVNAKGGVLSKILSGTLKLVGSLAAAIGSQFVGALVEAQRQGFAFREVWANSINALKSQFDLLKSGVFTFSTDIIRTEASLSRALGGTFAFTRDLTKSVAELNSLYNVSVEDATKLDEVIFRWSNNQANLVKSANDYIVALAKANGVAPGALIADMAHDTEKMAQFGFKGVEAFAKQEITLKRMGVSLQSLEGISDKVVSDFQGSLQSFARIQTFLPGFDASEIMFAAQFGKPDDVAKALQLALKRTGVADLSQLPRSFRIALQQALGLSYQEIENLLTGQKTPNAVPPTKADFETWLSKGANSIAGLLNQIIGILKGSIAGGFVAGLFGGKLLSAFKGVGAKTAGKAVTGGILSRMFGGLFKGGTAAAGAAELGGEEVAAGAVGGGLISTLGAAAAGIGSVAVALAPIAAAGALLFGAVRGFVDSRKAGNSIGKSLGNAATGAISLGFWRPFKSAAEDATKSAQKLAKSQNELSDETKELMLKKAAEVAGVQDFNLAMSLAAQQTGANRNRGFFGSIFDFLNKMSYKFYPFHTGGYVTKMGSKPVAIFNKLHGDDVPAVLRVGEMVLSNEQLDEMNKLSSRMTTKPNVVSDGGMSTAISKLGTSIISKSVEPVKFDVSALENKMDTLIHLLKTGGIAVNLDGRKVSSALMDSNRYE